MGAVSISPAQARAIAAWTRVGGDHRWITIEKAPSGTVLVRRGPSAHAFIGPSGRFEDVEMTRDLEPRRSDESDAGDRFAFIRKGARVRAWITAKSAMEVAAGGADESHRRQGEGLLDAMDDPEGLVPFSGVVVIPAPSQQAADPSAPVCVAIPDLDDTGQLTLINQEELEPAPVGPEARGG